MLLRLLLVALKRHGVDHTQQAKNAVHFLRVADLHRANDECLLQEGEGKGCEQLELGRKRAVQRQRVVQLEPRLDVGLDECLLVCGDEDPAEECPLSDRFGRGRKAEQRVEKSGVE